MLISHNKIALPPQTINQISQLSPLNQILIFDIETTGFHRIYDQIVSITMLYFTNEESYISQWFSENKADERELLLDAKPYFDSKSIHITYNGHSFDIPFLRTKYNNYSISISLNKSKCYDLYRFARKSLQLSSYTLKEIERALGIHRDDQLSGKDCTIMYQEFLKNNDQKIANEILQHNFEDVTHLIDLLPLANSLTSQQMNAFKIVEVFTYAIHWYIESISFIGHFCNISLWGYSELSELPNNQSNYLPDGASLILENQNFNQYLYTLKLPFYTKQLDNHNLACVDLTSFNKAIINQLEPHQIILQYDGLWLHEHITKLIEVLTSYYYCNSK